MKKIFSSLLLASTLLLAQTVTVPTVNTQTPITMDINGEHIDFSGYAGKYVILEYFGTHCPVCQMEIDHLKSMQQNNPKLEVISVELQNTPVEALKDFVFEKGINYPVIDFKNAYSLYMFAKNAAPQWQGAIPLMILFDKNGQALTYFMGVTSEEDIIKAIKDRTGVDINGKSGQSQQPHEPAKTNETNTSTNGSISNKLLHFFKW